MSDFKRDCFICGQYCEVIPDPKNPDSWEKYCGILYRTADRGKGNNVFKEVLLKVGYISYCRHILPSIQKIQRTEFIKSYLAITDDFYFTVLGKI